MRHPRAAPILLSTLVHRLAWGCSGPGAAEAMGRSFEIGAATWVATVGCAIAVFAVPRLRPVRAGYRALWVGLPLLQTFVVLVLGTTRGDCGFAMRSASFMVAAGLASLGAVAAFRLSRR
jgi:hypothetical protein